MKTFIAALLAVTSFCRISMADEILIYKAAETDKNSGNGQSTRLLDHYYGLIDITTSEMTFVQFSGTTKKNKTYNSYPNYPIISGILTPAKNKSDTVFSYSTNTTTSPFYVDLAIFQGANSQLALGGGYSGNFPKVLIYSETEFSGSGTAASDSLFKGSGVYKLDLSLTTQSNNATADGDGNNLQDAVTLVENFLKSQGY